MSLDNPFLEKTILTSTDNKYLKEDERFCPFKMKADRLSRKQYSRSIIHSDDIVHPKQRKIACLNVENKFLKAYTYGMKQPKLKKRSPRKLMMKRTQLSDELCMEDEREACAAPLSSGDFFLDDESSDDDFCKEEALTDLCDGAAFGSAPAALFGAASGSAQAALFGAASGSVPPALFSTVACSVPPALFGAAAGTAPGALFGTEAPSSSLPPVSDMFGLPAPAMLRSARLRSGMANSGFSFGAPKLLPQIVKHTTEFSSIHGMPVYHLKKMEFSVTFEPSFHSLEIDNELIKLQKIKEMKFKKMQLLNAISMALVYSPNFKDPNDTFRLFLIKCTDDVIKFDPEFILKVALYARQELHIRSASNFLLSYSAFNVVTRPYLKKYFEASLVLPSDWMDVAEQYLSFQDAHLVKRSLPSALKHVLKTSFKKFDEYQLAKYNRKKVVKKAIVEPVEKKHSKELKTFTIKQLIRLLHITSPVDHVMCILGKKYPLNSNMFQNSGLSGQWDSKKAGQRMKLPQPETWETKLSCEGNKAEVWENLIDNKKLPYMAMIRNLRNLIISGISDKHHEKVLNYLENKNAVIKSKQLPIQFYTAFKVIDEIEKLRMFEKPSECTNETSVKRSADGRKRRLDVLTEKVKDVNPLLLERYKKSISNAVEISAIHSILPIGGKTLLICDVSNLAVNANKDTTISTKKEKILNARKNACENCLIMGLMCLKACEDCKMKVIYGPDLIETVHVKDEPFLQTVSDLHKKIQDHIQSRYRKTSVFAANQLLLEHFQHFLKRETSQTLKLDHIIMFRGDSCIDSELMKSTAESLLNKYRHTINPDILYTHVDVAASDRNYPDLSSTPGKDVYLCGISSQILKFIAERSDGGQLFYVDNIDEKYELCKNIVTEQSITKSTAISEEAEISPLYTKLPKWHTIQIFISSTFKDMHAERDLLVRYVIPELKSRAASIFVKINEVDLRWGITETDCATKRATELCLIEAQRSDLLIGILGERYGSIYDFDTPDNPELDWVKDYPSGSSITELEMYAGALKDKVSNHNKAFFYFRDASFLSQVPQSWKSHFECEDSESKVKLQKLKQSIQNSGFKVFEKYPCYYAGIVKNTPLVAGLEKFGEAVLKDMWNSINQMHKNDPFLDEISEEDISQNEILENHGLFVGEKSSPMESFTSMLNKQEGIFVLCGASGCGKSSFIIRMLEKINGTSVIKFFIGVSPRSTDVSFMLQYITNVIARQFPISTLFPTTTKDIVNQFPDILLEAVKACNTTSFTLVIDGLDHLDLNDQRLEWLPLDIPKGMNIVCTTSDESLAYKVLCERKKNGCLTFIQELTSLQLPDREQLVRDSLQTYGKKLDESPFNNQMMQLVTKRDSGNPLYLQVACEYLRKFAVFDNLTSILQSFPSSLSHVFEEIILQLENEYGSVLIQIALSLLCISKTGLEENEFHLLLSFALLHVDAKSGTSHKNLIEQLQQIQPDDMLTQIKFRSLLHLLRTFVYGHRRSKLFILTNKEFEKAVKKHYLNKNYGRTVKYLHPVLGAYYRTLCDPRMDGSWNGYSSLSFRCLLYHLYHGMCYNELADVLCCHNFVEAAFNIKAADQLLEYFNFFLNNKNIVSSTIYKDINFSKLNYYYEFISRNSHILYSFPHLLYQQACNEPSDSLAYLPASEIKSSSFECLTRSSILEFRCHTLGGFLKNIVSVAYDKWAPVALFGSEDGYLKVFDLSSKKICNSFKGHHSAITFICCVGKNRICTASADNTLSIWNNFDYTRIAVLKGHRHFVTGCCSDTSGSVLFSSAWDHSVRLWSSVDGRQISIIDDFRCPVNCIDHHPEQQEIACGLWNGNVEIWNTIALKKKLVLHGRSGSIKSVNYAPDGITILSSSINSEVIIWSSTEGLKVACLSGHILPVKSISCSKANNVFVTAGEDCTLKVWPNNTTHSAIILSQCKFCPISFMEFVQKSHLAIAFQNSVSWIVDIKDGHNILAFDSKVDPVTCFSKLHLIDETESIDHPFHKYGTSLIFGTLSGKIMALDFSSSSPETVGTINTKVTALIHCYRFVFCGSDNGDIGVFSLTDINYSRVIFGAHQGSITALTFTVVNETVNALSASTDKLLKLWRVTTENPIDLSLQDTYCSKHKDCITCCCFFKEKLDISEEMTLTMLTGSHDNNVILWDCDHQNVLKILQTSVIRVFYSKSYIVGCARDGSVAVWSHEGKLISFIKSITKSTAALTFDFREDAKTFDEFDIDLAYVDSDGSVVVKHPLQRTHLCSLEGHSKIITSCSSGDNGEILSCSLDGTVNMWKIPLDMPSLQLKHSGEISGISLSSSCKMAVSSDIHGNVVLWEVDSKSEHPLTYLANKTFSGGCVTDVTWITENNFGCAYNLLVDNEETYRIKILCCEHSSSDGNGAYILREMSTYYAESEVITLDYNKENDCIAASLKSGYVILITPDFHETLFVIDDWVLAATFTSGNPSFLCTVDPRGIVQCYSMSNVLTKASDLLDPYKSFETTETLDAPYYTTALYCESKTAIYTGDSIGWLRKFTDNSQIVKQAHIAKITGICVLGPNVFTSSFDKTIKGWNSSTLDQISQFHSAVPVTCLAVPEKSSDADSSKSHILVFGTTTGNVHLLMYHSKI